MDEGYARRIYVRSLGILDMTGLSEFFDYEGFPPQRRRGKPDFTI
jgi:hypothetical protein